MQRLVIAAVACLSFVVASCLEDDAIPVLYDTYVDIWVRDLAGNSLLDPTIDGHFDPEDIKIYYVYESDTIEILRPRQDHPRNYSIIEHAASGRIFLRVLPNEGTYNDEETVTLIEWAPGHMDNLRCVIGRTNEAIFTRKIWYNGQLRFDVDNVGANGNDGTVGRFVDVIK